MSYDLMVFDPVIAPADRPGFLHWYDLQTEWTEGHGYDDPAVSSPILRGWFGDMVKTFPAMNGPYASGAIDDVYVTDYSIGTVVIYAAFAWSIAEVAYSETLRLASMHRVGFYDVSSAEGSVWLPSASGAYQVVYSE